MSANPIIFFIFYFLIVVAVLGFGIVFRKIIFKSSSLFNLGFDGLVGIFILTIYSYVSHFFFSHNLEHNFLVILTGLIMFFLNYNKIKYNFELKIFISVFLILFFAFIAFKTHDDFSYYHFGYTNYINESKFLIGVGNFNHGFRTPSSIFYLNSLFYLPIVEKYMFHIGAIIIMGYSLIHLITLLNYKYLERDNDYIFFLILLSIIFIFIFFYRISEHGSDRSAQILIFLLFIEIFIFFKFLRTSDIFLGKILILSSLIISLKSFYFVYFIILIPILFLLKKNDKLGILKNLLKIIPFYLASLLILSVLLVNFFNTGCLVYPVYFTCFSDFEWSILINDVKLMNSHYENWAKAGAGPNFKVDNIENHIMYFNWVPNWIDNYFFNKVSDFLFGILFLILIIYLSFFSAKKNKKKQDTYLLPIYFFLIILFFEWFYNHPALRYGGYILICLLIFIPISKFLERNKLNFKQLQKRISVLLLVTAIIFLFRNVNRINDEIIKYNFNPFQDFRYELSDNHYRINNRISGLINIYDNCKIKTECDFNGDYEVTKKYKTYMFININ
tara:strand:- start:811 stop:2487 length:1677 start_codon:yes stop_codon:yes gene_type:complete